MKQQQDQFVYHVEWLILADFEPADGEASESVEESPVWRLVPRSFGDPMIENGLLIGFRISEGESHSHARLGKNDFGGNLKRLVFPVDAHHKVGSRREWANRIDIASTPAQIRRSPDNLRA